MVLPAPVDESEKLVTVCQVLQDCFRDLDSMVAWILRLVELVQQVSRQEQSCLPNAVHRS